MSKPSERGNALQQTPCRLCDGAATFRFSRLVLDKHPVAYWRCDRCGSLQTDAPYWLDESYQTVHSAADTGMAARTLQMAQATSLLLKLLGVGAEALCLDWGGGNGLFCRMMRDQGYNFLNEDKYAAPFYAAGFALNRAAVSHCDVITSFEVFEHLSNPSAELAEIFGFRPLLWIFSTQLYEDQEDGWNYLAPRTGRHVFFYGQKGLDRVACANGYRFARGRHLHMFVRNSDNPLLKNALGRALAFKLLSGGKLVGFAAGLHFLARQRHAYRYWQADSGRAKPLESARDQT